ncbi:MAG: phosphonate C-P lyase system protein PhnG [Pseudomonadota bacterium]
MTSNDIEQRQQALAILAKSPLEKIEEHWLPLQIQSNYTLLKKPEVAMVMVKAQSNSEGQAFNMGEMTVTHCVLRLDNHCIGYGYIAGRCKNKALLVALIDAHQQSREYNQTIIQSVITPLKQLLIDKQQQQACKVQKTKVDFFTMVRGE